jgi:hypothetical protein
MPLAPTHPPPSTLRRRLAALQPGRPTTIACAIAIVLAAVGLDAGSPDAGPAVGGPPPATEPAALPPSGMALTDSGLVARRERSTPLGGRRADR